MNCLSIGFLLYLIYMFDCVSCNVDFSVPSNKEIGFKKEFVENCGNTNNNCNCDKFVDPHDMRNYIHSSKTMSSNHKSCHHRIPTKGCENCAAYLQRFVGLFLSATGLKDYVLTRSNSKIVNLNLVVKRENLEVLQTFLDSGNVELAIINKALTDILTTKDAQFFDEEMNQQSIFGAFVEYAKDVLMLISNNLSFYIAEHPMHLLVLCVTSVFAITLWQIVKTRSYCLLTFSLFFITFSAGFVWNWVRLYKIADIKRFTTVMLNEDLPLYCRPDQMKWYQYLFYYYSYERDCQEYYKKVMIDPIVDVPPTIVLAETITFIFYPAGQLGTAIGSFTRGLIDTVPWPYKIVFVPFILILSALSVLVILTILLKARLRLNVFPFSSLEISSSHGCTNNACFNRSRSATALIEDVSNTPIDSGITESLCKSKPKKAVSGSPKSKLKLSLPEMTEKNRKEVASILKRLKDEDLLLAKVGGSDKEIDCSIEKRSEVNSKNKYKENVYTNLENNKPLTLIEKVNKDVQNNRSVITHEEKSLTSDIDRDNNFGEKENDYCNTKTLE